MWFLEWGVWSRAIALVLAGFVAFELALVRLASSSFEGPDEQNYYKLGLEYNRELERQQRQRDQGWQLLVRSQNPLRCQVLDRQRQPLTGTLTVRFKRPATRSQDQTVVARPNGHEFVANWQARPGQWLVLVELDSQGQRFTQQLRWTMP